MSGDQTTIIDWDGIFKIPPTSAINNRKLQEEMLEYGDPQDGSGRDKAAAKKLEDSLEKSDQDHKHDFSKKILHRLSFAYICTLVVLLLQGFGIQVACIGSHPFNLDVSVQLALVGLPLAGVLIVLIRAVWSTSESK